MNTMTNAELLSNPVIGALEEDLDMLDVAGPAFGQGDEDDASIFSDIVAEPKPEGESDKAPGKTRYKTTQAQQHGSESQRGGPNPKAEGYNRTTPPPHPDEIIDEEEAERIRKRGWKEHDVPLGRSQEVREFIGNIRYRELVEEHRQAYKDAAKRADKTAISNTIFGIIKGRGGRFLDKKVDKKSGTETWFEISQEKALAKVSQALRIPSTAQAAIQQQQYEQSQQQHYHGHHYQQPPAAALTYPGGGFASPHQQPRLDGAAYPAGEGATEPAPASLHMSPPRSMTGMEISVPQDGQHKRTPSFMRQQAHEHMSPVSPHCHDSSGVAMDYSGNTQSTTHNNSNSQSMYMPHWGETSQGALSEESSSAGSKRRRDHAAATTVNPRPDLFRNRSSDDAMMNLMMHGGGGGVGVHPGTPVRANMRRRSDQPIRRRGGRRPSRAFAKAQSQKLRLSETDDGDDWKVRQTRSFSEGLSWDTSEEESMELDSAAGSGGHWPSSSWNVRSCHSFTEGEGYHLRQQLQRRRLSAAPSLEEHFSRFRPDHSNTNEEEDFQNISSSISEELAVDKLVQELDLEPIPVPTVARRSKAVKKKKATKGSSSGTPSVSKSV